MISIIIIVKNDLRIEKLLASLQEIIQSEQEVIVVDASNGLLDSIKNQFTFAKWIAYFNPRKNRTYAEQRNIGIKHAKGNIIVFIDADCIPEKNWLMNLIKPIEKENEKIVSGACRPLYKNFIHKEEKYPKYRNECETMNVAIHKNVFEKIGFFDETLEGCEDSDFCIRAREKGFAIRFVKSAVIYHDWGGFKKNITRAFNGGRDRALLYRKHKKYITSLSINNIYTYYYILYIIFFPVTFIYPSYILILFIPSVIKKRNPVKEIFNLCFSIGFLKQIVYL